MARALSLICLGLVICIAGTAWAKPKIAVLGLEVAPGPTGAVDPAMTMLAREITKDLRQRAQSAASPYAVAPNGNKELTDEKLLMSCDDEATACMAVIGAGLATDVLLYGRLERKGDLYRVSLKLLDVKAKTIEATSEDMPIGGAAASVGRKLFSKVIGEVPVAAAGTLVVRARGRGGAVDGRVIVDEQARGELADGRLTVTGLGEGRHVVAIETDGRYARFEETVTIRGGQQASLDALLVERGAPPASASHSLVWKVGLGLGIALVAAGGGYAYYANDRVIKNNDAIVVVAAERPDGAPGETWDNPQSVGASDCGKSAEVIARELHSVIVNSERFERTCTWHSRIYLGFVAGGAGALATIASLIMLSRDPGPAEKPASARTRKSQMAIVPMLHPDGAGATFTLRW